MRFTKDFKDLFAHAFCLLTAQEAYLRIFTLTLLLLLMQNFSFAQGTSVTPFTSLSQEGNYELQQGTDDCPHAITWKAIPRCGGFSLSETNSTDTSRIEYFCHLNKNTPTEITHRQGNESFRVRYEVKADSRLAQKSQQIERNINGAPYTVELEASVILDDGGSFMYDRSLSGNGWSCLYKKR